MPDYFGEKLRAAEEFPYFLEAEFHEARTREDLPFADSMGYALRFTQACIHPDDRANFLKLSRANNAKLEDWMSLTQEFVAEAAARPTGQPTGSSDGRETTSETSESEPVASVTAIPTEPKQANGAIALALARSRAV